MFWKKKKEEKGIRVRIQLQSTASQDFLIRYYDPAAGRYFIHEGKRLWEKELFFTHLPQQLNVQVFALPTIRPLAGTVSLNIFLGEEMLTKIIRDWQAGTWLKLEAADLESRVAPLAELTNLKIAA